MRCTVLPLVAQIVLLSASAAALQAAPPAPADPLGRLNPRSAVTNFLEACHGGNYAKAAQYLDLAKISPRERSPQGQQLARELESILNSDSHFDVLQLSQSEQGNLNDDPDPSVERIATVTANGETFTLTLARTQPATGPQIWLFSPSTVADIPKLSPVPTTESALEARLPRFLVASRVLETPLWKWIALLCIAIILALIFRFIVHLIHLFLRSLETRRKHPGSFAWLQAVLEPALVLVFAMLFRIAEEVIGPSAIARLYIGDTLLLAVVWSVAWGLINLLELFLLRVQGLLDPRQRVVSRSVIYLGRRVIKIIVVVLAALVVLNNWGFNMTTIIAGLGVGGIAVALAAQQTIANVFGGVSVIGDSPVLIGDFGNFGGVIGTVEEIGMRSTRVRTLNRTVVSVPNASFAGMNLENYAVRDKILFNPTLQVKRATPKDQIRRCMEALKDVLAQNKSIETGPSPIRITALSAASFAIEIFAYVLTADLDEFYKIEAELYLAIDDALANAGVELA